MFWLRNVYSLLIICWTFCSLWNVGLVDETLSILSSFLPQCVNVRSLHIEANTPPIKEENFHLLLKEDSLLTSLWLRHNGITDVGACRISNVRIPLKRLGNLLNCLTVGRLFNLVSLFCVIFVGTRWTQKSKHKTCIIKFTGKQNRRYWSYSFSWCEY